MHSPFLSTMARHFLAVAEARSITEAGQALHVAPSAVSRQVALMESVMGCALFERQARGMALTEAGERLRTWLTTVQREADEVQRQVQGLGPAAVQRLHLACTEGFTTAFMPALMGRFRAAMPGARLFLRVGDGLVLRSRLWMGARIVPMLPGPLAGPIGRFASRPAMRRRALPRELAPGLARHCLEEYANLAALLPELYAAYGAG